MAAMRLIPALIFSTILVVFGAQNTQSVTFHFFTFNLGPAPVVLAVFVAALLGLTAGWLIAIPDQVRGARSRRSLEQEVTAANEKATAAVAEMEESQSRARPHVI